MLKVPPSIAEGSSPTSDATIASEPAGRSPLAWVVGLVLAALALLLYAASNGEHLNFYNHFVWQADAFLHGRVSFPYPVPAGASLPQNDYFQDVYPLTDAAGDATGQVLLPFPPLPALVLLPFVAMWGFATDQEAIAICLGGLGVGLAWWMLGGLRLRLTVRAMTTAIFATGTVWWWASAVGSTWYLAHLVAVNVALLAVGVTLRHDGQAAEQDPWSEADEEAEALEARLGRPLGRLEELWRSTWPPDRWQVLAGFLLGVAATARLPLVFAAPWFIFVGGGGSVRRRLLSAGLGGFLPVAALLAYTYLTTGALLHPGYDYQYQLEANGYPTLGYHPEWSVEDPRYVPQNLGILFGALPAILPDVAPDTLGFSAPHELCTQPGAIRSLFNTDCPLAIPLDIGTSIVVSAPGLLLAVLAFRARRSTRIAIGTFLAVGIVGFFNLMHFSQGWVQWGYRFSLDFLPFLLPMVALGAADAEGRPRLAAWALVVVGALVNLWGVIWGGLLAW